MSSTIDLNVAHDTVLSDPPFIGEDIFDREETGDR